MANISILKDHIPEETYVQLEETLKDIDLYLGDTRNYVAKDTYTELERTHQDVVGENQELLGTLTKTKQEAQLDLLLATSGVADEYAKVGIRAELQKCKINEEGVYTGLEDVITKIRNEHPQHFMSASVENKGANPPTPPTPQITDKLRQILGV